MFSFLRKESMPLQLYGKLPLAKDYLRVGCGQGAGLALRQWLDSAYSGAAQAEPPSLAYPMRFVIGEHWGNAMTGSAWPSSDAGGLRPFPFALFVERKRKPLTEDVARGFERTTSVWRKLDAFYGAGANYSDGQGLLTALRGKEVAHEEIAPVPTEPVQLESWLAALFPGEGRAGLDRTLAELDRLRRARHREPFRLPLARDLPIASQVHAWWTVAVELGLFEREEVPTLFFPHEGAPWREERPDEPAFLTLFRRPPAPAEARWLASIRERGEPAAGDLCAADARELGRAELASEGLPLLADSLRGALAAFRAKASPR